MFKKIRSFRQTVVSFWSSKKPKDQNLERAFAIIKPALADSESLISLERSQDLDQLMDRFQATILENETLLASNRKDSLILESQIESRTQRVRDSVMGERERLQALRHIKGLNTRLVSLKKQSKIYSDNIDLHEQLKNRIKEMAALSMKTVETAQIDDLSVTYQEARDSHRDTILAGKHALTPEGEAVESFDEMAELKALEAEIMSEPPTESKKPVPVISPPILNDYSKSKIPPFFETEIFRQTLEAAKQQNDVIRAADDLDGPAPAPRPSIEIYGPTIKPRMSLKFPRQLESE